MTSEFKDWQRGNNFGATVGNMIVRFTGWSKTDFKWPWQGVTVSFNGYRGNAEGGAYYGGSWHNIAQYSMGGAPSHGSMFIAGESGAEVVGHLN